MNKTTTLRRLPLEGSPNTRDLGGYPCKGGMTRWGVFLRSASTYMLTDNDLATLRNFGVSTAIDLRSEEERVHHPSRIEKMADFDTYHVSLLDQMNSNHFQGDLPGSMSGLYISILENNKEDIVDIFTYLADAKGVALFNCTAGKDRTGVVAMLLLHLAGVQNADIEADYAITEIYMRDIFAGQLASLGDLPVPEYVFRSLPESMRRVLLHLEEKYTSAEKYLRAAGLPDEKIALLKEKLIQS